MDSAGWSGRSPNNTRRTDGRYYEGHWRLGKMHGKGKLGKAGGKFKLGEWDNGKLLTPNKELSTQATIHPKPDAKRP